MNDVGPLCRAGIDDVAICGNKSENNGLIEVQSVIIGRMNVNQCRLVGNCHEPHEVCVVYAVCRRSAQRVINREWDSVRYGVEEVDLKIAILSWEPACG